MRPAAPEPSITIAALKGCDVACSPNMPARRGLAFDGILLGVEGAHVVDEAASDHGRRFCRLKGMDIGLPAGDCESGANANKPPPAGGAWRGWRVDR